MTRARRPVDAAGPAYPRSEIAMTAVSTPTIAATASTWYAGAPSLTTVRRAQSRTKRGLPGHGRSGHTIVALHGDLDIASSPALREHLIGTLHHSSRILILDLGEVRFCDATGLAVLIGTGRRATALGITMHLANPRPQVAKLLRITGLDRSLTVSPTVCESLAPPVAHAG
ncbi:STAS domain-containing protein [Actinomadura keratinilytica]|uniref:Anti-sigma factor antagonist n=1 Tax=Actinomadura keratinilytica TaxID=547461 RepID=A0ABP7ZIN9_9ACTN